MDRRVDTQSKRIRCMNNILSELEKYDGNIDMLKSQASTLLMSYVDSEGNDFKPRTNAIDCANLIFYSLKELQSLDSTYHISNDKSYVYKWIKLDEYDLLEYVPDCITEIVGVDGQKYDSKVTDFYACFAPLKKWIKPEMGKNGKYIVRGNNLQANDDFFYPDEDNIKANEEPKKEIEKLNAQMKPIKKEMESYLNMINDETYSSIKDDLMASLSTLDEKYKDLEHKKDAIKLLPERKYGYYYDDYFLLQRNIRNIKRKPLRIITGSSTHRGAWGKIITENTYETIAQDVIENERETNVLPLFPSPEDFKDFVAKDNYSNKKCLLKDIKSLMYIKRLHDKELPPENYFDKLKFSENDLKEKQTVTITDEPLNTNDCLSLIKRLPEYFYYENENDKTFMLAKVIDKKTKIINPVIKDIYKDKYNRAKDLVKFVVYDDKDFNRFYKDNKYAVEISLELDYSNMSDKNLKSIPILKVGDEMYMHVCTNYQKMLLEDLTVSSKIYNESPEATRSNDPDATETYPQFIDYVKNAILINNTQCNVFLDYCSKNILQWVNERIDNLVKSTVNIDNATLMINHLQERLTKGSGTLLIWYQTITQFDETYANSLLSKKIVEDSSKYMLVTRGYDGGDNPDMFNKHLYCDYIDIQETSELYGNKKFNVGDEIYIAKNLKEQKNRIKDIGTIEIKVVDNLNPLDEPNTVEVTRLYLERKLLKWCNTDEPTEVLISKLIQS